MSNKNRKSFRRDQVDTEIPANDLQTLSALGYGDFDELQKQFSGQINFDDTGMWVGRVHMTSIGLPPDTVMNESEYQTIGEVLSVLQGSLAWMIGDFILYGETLYGRTTVELAEAFGLEVSTIHTYTWLCRHINFSTRVKNLPPTAHRPVATMNENEQHYWLQLASENQWSERQLRKAIKDVHSDSSTVSIPVWRKTIDRLTEHATPGRLKKMSAADRQQLRDHLLHIISQIDQVEG